MRINVRLLLITFLIVTIVSISSTIIYYNLSNRIIYTQQTKSILNSTNQFIFTFQEANTQLTNDFRTYLNNPGGFDIESSSVDFIFTVQKDSLIYPENLTSKKDKIDNRSIITIREFSAYYPNTIIKIHRTNNNSIYYGKLIDFEFLNSFGRKINSDIALLSNGIPIEISNDGLNSKYIMPLLDAGKKLKNKNNFDLVYSELNNEDFFAVYFRPASFNAGLTSKNNLSFLIFNTPNDSFDFRATLRLIMFIIIIAGTSLSLIFILLFTTKFRKQVALLTAAAETIGEGNLEYRVEIVSNDEIGTLGNTFNSMLDQLKIKEAAEKQYTDFIAMINKNPTLKEISDAALYKIINSTKLTFGILSLVDENNIRKISSFGLLEDPAHLKTNSNLYEKVIESEEPIEFNFSENFPVIKTGLTEITIKYLLITPIIYNDKVIAILELASESQPATDVNKYIESINEQLALGLANAEVVEQLENYIEQLKTLNENYQKQNEQISEQNKELIQLHEKLKEKAAELEVEREKAFELSRVKSQFLASMSHELKTPLNSILGLTELTLNDSTTLNRTKDRLNIVLKNGKKLLNLITNILEFSKLETSKLELNKSSFILNDFINELKLLAQPLFFGKKVLFEIHLSGTEELLISTDKIKLEHILNNLISNAAKFTTIGSVKLNVIVIDYQNIKFEVIDSGSGIPAEELEIIFKEFEQSSDSKVKKIGGTGLGLAIADKYIKLLGSSIDVESMLGKGSRFSFTLSNVIIEHIPTSYSPEKMISKEIKKILIAGNNRQAADFLKQILDCRNCNFIFQNDVEENSSDEKFDLIIINNDLSSIEHFNSLITLNSKYPEISKIFITLTPNGNLFSLKNTEFVTVHSLTASLKMIFNDDDNEPIIGLVENGMDENPVTPPNAILEKIPSGKFDIEDPEISKYDAFIIKPSINMFGIIQLINLNRFTSNQRVFILIPEELTEPDFKIINESFTQTIAAKKTSIQEITNLLASKLNISSDDFLLTSDTKDETNNASEVYPAGNSILIVDDDTDTLFTVSEILNNLGYKTFFAKNGLECISKLKTLVPDVVLLDIRMPEMDGFQTIKEIRKNEKLQSLKVIALTAHAMLEEKEIIKLSGFDDLITKPINNSILISKVGKFISTKKS